MCGIIGIWGKNNNGNQNLTGIDLALERIAHRGPDHKASKIYSNLALGHVRLSIIDTDERSHQPFFSKDERYCLVFNGEIYNYRELRANLESKGVEFTTASDTEVLLQILIHEGKNALQKLNGFFAFAFYDQQENTVLIARDRMGIKPLLVYEDVNMIAFSSELNGLFDFNGTKEIDKNALNHYFGLTYIPAPYTVLKHVRKLMPGEYGVIRNNEIVLGSYAEQEQITVDLTYDEAKAKLYKTLNQSVADRMVADVPLGCFLSGGVDSSIIAALAKKQNAALKTFSVGFDHPFFNETQYAQEVADHIDSDHTVYTLTKTDFKKHFAAFLNTIDEPFADSSAFAMFLLAKKTKQEVTVALSGDGADELFGGYRKHYAEYRMRKMNPLVKLGLKSAGALFKSAKNNRSDKWGDLNRKIQKLRSGLKLAPAKRYWDWCQFIQADDRERLMFSGYKKMENPINGLNWENLNAVFLADQQMVLPNDMLKKVDLMSMASALEVRTPFLDYRVVDLANSLPADFKVNAKGGKQILKDTFTHLLPTSVIERSKKGFEIPIYDWLGDEIAEQLNGPLFSEKFIEEQGLFNYSYFTTLLKDWRASDFGDRIYMVWSLIIFQHWWNRYMAA